jgi:hypothetical protein
LRETLIPHVPLIDFQSVLFAESPELVLERLLTMMLFLIANVFLESRDVNWTYRESAVSPLPIKLSQMLVFELDPFGRISLQIPEKVLKGNALAESTQNVNVVFHSPDNDGRTLQVVADSAKVGVQPLTKLLVTEIGNPLLG